VDERAASPTPSSSAFAFATYCACRARNCERCGSTISSGSSTLSRVVRQGSSDGCWNAMPVILSGPSTLRPSTRTSPFVGRRKPVASFMKVDLPQPEGPTTAMNSPRRACRVIASTA